ncbi:hypothetical protein [Fusobacterium ulcerans]|uniref:hypothetical protein n=1 Tax=Fusobacterium ulcerans TaxID=861 RepID=UPI0026DD3FA9|nr:hypothetical protein [Fusobacterium ulcerans]
MKVIYVYDQNLKLIGKPQALNFEAFKINPIEYYPNWENTMFASEQIYESPIIDESGEIRNKTREELILLDNEIEKLEPGEYIENGKIIKVEYDETLKYYKREWNADTHEWYDSITKEELVEIRKNKLLEYAAFEKEKIDLENIEFSAIEEIAILEEKMNLLKIEIDKIASESIYLSN